MVSSDATPLPPVMVRPATPADARGVIALIRELADFEHLAGPGPAAAARFERHIADADRLFGLFVAESPHGLVAYALYFFTYSTFRGQPKLYIEDLFVRSEHRGRGIGRALFLACAREAARRGCSAMEWAVLDWNVDAQRFYRRQGAQPHTEWHLYGIDDRTVSGLAAAPPPEGTTIASDV